MGLPEQSGGGMDELSRARRARVGAERAGVKRFSMHAEWSYNCDFSEPECKKPGGDIRAH
jgi:hypothetical protein